MATYTKKLQQCNKLHRKPIKTTLVLQEIVHVSLFLSQIHSSHNLFHKINLFKLNIKNVNHTLQGISILRASFHTKNYSETIVVSQRLQFITMLIYY